MLISLVGVCGQWLSLTTMKTDADCTLLKLLYCFSFSYFSLSLSLSLSLPFSRFDASVICFLRGVTCKEFEVIVLF